MLRRFVVSASRHGSSAFCLRAFSTLRSRPEDLYRAMGYTPHTNNETTNFLQFLGQIRTPQNIKYAFTKLGSDQIRALFQVAKMEDLKRVPSDILSKIFAELDANSFKKIYQSPDDLIFFYKKVGMDALDRVPDEVYTQIITTKPALTKVITAFKDEVTEGVFTDKQRFIRFSFDMENIQRIVLNEEKDKNDITPVLYWLIKHFSHGNEFGEYKDKNDLILSSFTVKFLSRRKCPIGLDTLEPIIKNLQNLKQVFEFFDDKQRMLDELCRPLNQFIVNIHDFVTFSKLFVNAKEIDSLHMIFNSHKIEELLIKSINENPDVTFLQYKEWLSPSIKMKYPKFEEIETFEDLHRGVNSKKSSFCP